MRVFGVIIACATIIVAWYTQSFAGGSYFAPIGKDQTADLIVVQGDNQVVTVGQAPLPVVVQIISNEQKPLAQVAVTFSPLSPLRPAHLAQLQNYPFIERTPISVTTLTHKDGFAAIAPRATLAAGTYAIEISNGTQKKIIHLTVNPAPVGPGHTRAALFIVAGGLLLVLFGLFGGSAMAPVLIPPALAIPGYISLHTAIVIPTFNEVTHIELLIRSIFQQYPDVTVIVVDRESPDGTAAVIKKLQSSFPRLELMSCAVKTGISAAYALGFEYAFTYDFQYIIQMDGNFSHNPMDIAKLMHAIRFCDVAIGSRYVGKFGFIKMFRNGKVQLINLYARLLLRRSIMDWTSGFVAWRAAALRTLGYRMSYEESFFQMALKYRAAHAGYRIAEVPIESDESVPANIIPIETPYESAN